MVFRSVGEDVPEAELLHNLLDRDPQRDVKDIAFAQAYLEKVGARISVSQCYFMVFF